MFGTVTELVHLEGSPTGLDLGCEDVESLAWSVGSKLGAYVVYARILDRDARLGRYDLEATGYRGHSYLLGHGFLGHLYLCFLGSTG